MFITYPIKLTGEAFNIICMHIYFFLLYIYKYIVRGWQGVMNIQVLRNVVLIRDGARLDYYGDGIDF